MSKRINVIDLFAGPGGLGEGFSSLKIGNDFPFDIQMSVEKEASAHKTLTLRSFYRKFRGKKTPAAYYEYIKNPELGTKFLAKEHPEEWAAALKETLERPQELGSEDDEQIFKKLKKIKKESNEPFVVIGGPPCQAFSVMGRIKNSSLAGYIAEDDHRHFLYKEYLKVIDTVKPEIFVMENVRGIITAKLNGERMFPLIIEDLECPGKALGRKTGQNYFIYSLSHEPESISKSGKPSYKSDQDFVIKAEDFGIPQNRHRVILLGVRADIAKNIQPSILTTSKKVATDQLIEGLPKLRSAVSRQPDNEQLWIDTVKKEGTSLVSILKNENQKELALHVKNLLLDIKSPKAQRGNKQYFRTKEAGLDNTPEDLKKFIADPNLDGQLNHFSRSHMISDLQRYLFCAAFSEINKNRNIPSPSKRDFPEALAPNHKSWESGKFADRFRVQFRGKPASTITSHINRDGHYFIHYDPKQCRSLSAREAARLQTFPDNYFFEGTQTQQYVQVGNAVPPYLAYKISNIVHAIFDAKTNKTL